MLSCKVGPSSSTFVLIGQMPTFIHTTRRNYGCSSATSNTPRLTVSLVRLHACVERAVHRDLFVVRTQAVAVRVVVREQTALRNAAHTTQNRLQDAFVQHGREARNKLTRVRHTLEYEEQKLYWFLIQATDKSKISSHDARSSLPRCGTTPSDDMISDQIRYREHRPICTDLPCDRLPIYTQLSYRYHKPLDATPAAIGNKGGLRLRCV